MLTGRGLDGAAFPCTVRSSKCRGLEDGEERERPMPFESFSGNSTVTTSPKRKRTYGTTP